MGNHFHIIVYCPDEDSLPSDSVIAARYNAYYGKRKMNLEESDHEGCREAGRKMIDLSEFMKHFQRKFTHHINRTHNMRGKLWADRFKSVILQRESSLWNCVKYVELNPVRAEMTDDPASYRFSSWGRYNGSGKHPFHENFVKHMRDYLGETASDWSDDKIYADFRAELVRTIACEAGLQGEELHEQVENARKARESMPLRFLRRTRHWTDGAIIGTKAFVQEVAANFDDAERVRKKQMSRGTDNSGTVIHCFRKLQTSLS
jgi:hypothetical protein